MKSVVECLRKAIPESVLLCFYKITECGYESILTGGAIRDILLGLPPNDFDLVTNAPASLILKIFPESNYSKSDHPYVAINQYGVSIQISSKEKKLDGNVCSNEFFDKTTLAADSEIRDFSVNSLYYSPMKGIFFDSVSGVNDIRSRILRFANADSDNFSKNPRLIFRAIRISNRCGLVMSSCMKKSLTKNKIYLSNIHPLIYSAEILQILRSGYSLLCVEDIYNFELINEVFYSNSQPCCDSSESEKFLKSICLIVDENVKYNTRMSSEFILCVFLWPHFNHSFNFQTGGGEEKFFSFFNRLICILPTWLVQTPSLSYGVIAIWYMYLYGTSNNDLDSGITNFHRYLPSVRNLNSIIDSFESVK